MSPFRSRFPALLTASMLAAFCSVPSPARADDHPRSDDAYPTDVCVDHKLRAAADYCREAVWAWDRGDPSQSVDARLAQGARAARVEVGGADERSLAAGVSCEETTATSDEMIGAIDAGAEDLAAAIATSEGAGRGHGRNRCGKHHERDRCSKRYRNDERGEHDQCVNEDNAERMLRVAPQHARRTGVSPTAQGRCDAPRAIATATAIAASSSGAAAW